MKKFNDELLQKAIVKASKEYALDNPPDDTNVTELMKCSMRASGYLVSDILDQLRLWEGEKYRGILPELLEE